MASLRTLLRLNGAGQRSVLQQWITSRPCSTMVVEEDHAPIEYDVRLIQDRASRPVRKDVTPKGKSRVMRALARTWRPLNQPLAAGFRARTDPMVHSVEVEKEIEQLGEEAASFMAKYHDVRFGEAFPWTDPAKPPDNIGQRLGWYADRLDIDGVNETRQELIESRKLTQHLENCWLDACLSWRIIDFEIQRVDAIDEGRGPDAETQLLMEEDLLSQLRSTWSEVVMKDGVAHGLYASALAHICQPAISITAVESAHEDGFQVPLTTFQYMLEKLPKSWDRRTPPLEDAAKVEEVMNVLTLMTVGPRAAQPDALTFQRACSAFHYAGMPGANKVFSILAEMDYCRTEATLGTYYYVFSAAMNYLNRPEILQEIIKRLTVSKRSLTVRSEEDLQFMNLAVQQLALNPASVSAGVVNDATKLLSIAKETGYACVQNRAALIDDYARLIGCLEHCSNSYAENLTELVEDAVETGCYLNFHTYAVLGSMGEGLKREYTPGLFTRAWKVMKKQLILQQYNIIFPATLLQTNQLTKSALGGGITKTIQLSKVAQMPLLEGLLEDLKLFEVLEDATKPFKFPIRDDNNELLETHQQAVVPLYAFKNSLHSMLHGNIIQQEMAGDLLNAMKEICVLHLCVGMKPTRFDVLTMAELAIASNECDLAIIAVKCLINLRFMPGNQLLSQLTHQVLQGTDELTLLGTLAVVATCGIRLPNDRYKTIGAQFSRPVLLTALWLGEHTVEIRSGRELSTDLVRVWPHVLEAIKARRDGIDDFLLDDVNKDGNARNLKKLFEEMTVKKRISPLDVVEKPSADTLVDVFDTAESDDVTIKAEDTTVDVEGVLKEAELTESEYRGSKTFKDPRKGRR
eukprot:scpid12771/ scgid12006/ 